VPKVGRDGVRDDDSTVATGEPPRDERGRVTGKPNHGKGTGSAGSSSASAAMKTRPRSDRRSSDAPAASAYVTSRTVGTVESA
jgi:hypothetical protein